MNINKTLIAGNITRDPETRYTQSGTAATEFTVAVNRKWRNKASDLQEETAFIGVKAFGKQAETIGQYMRRGSQIFVEGRLTQDTWEDKASGQKRSKTYVMAENFQFGNRPGGNDNGNDYGAPAPSMTRATPTEGANAPLPPDDDVPF